MTGLRLASMALVGILGLSCRVSGPGQSTTEPFRFRFGASHRGVSGGEVWDAIVNPVDESDSLPPAFRLELPPRARQTPPGARIQAIIRRGDQRGMTFLLLSLGDTFVISEQPKGLMAVAMEPVDSVPLTLTVQSRRRSAPWTALAVLPNGGRFLLAIDSSAGRGEFRSVGRDYDARVFLALAALSAPRQ
jgi:hypothetical protein